jgi:hypothetical protein
MLSVSVSVSLSLRYGGCKNYKHLIRHAIRQKGGLGETKTHFGRSKQLREEDGRWGENLVQDGEISASELTQ